MTARGIDTAWARARRAAQRASARKVEEDLVQARASGDRTREARALKATIEQLKQEVALWVAEAE
ncbi:hypothetical protein GCM10018781_70040 [Kitasatospora indigofera]|uniref:Uncharacterized protein n=1 Tax=Kitasatospora indigofera TaxID=67307 RepID=A0A919L448_9ACTN|nr:hypothetical protein GCM10018781_70040 [Kitasatospora indigofera]